MQGHDAPALGARPLFFFFEQMLFHADSFGADAIPDQTDLIPLSVTFVQPLDGDTGKDRALETKIKSLAGYTIFDLAFSLSSSVLKPAEYFSFTFAKLSTITSISWAPISRSLL